MTTNKDFRQKTDQELIDIVRKLRIKLLEYRFKNSTGEFAKPHQILYARRTLAQALTILSERKVDIAHLQLQKLSEMDKEHSFFKTVNDAEEAKKVAAEKTVSEAKAIPTKEIEAKSTIEQNQGESK